MSDQPLLITKVGLSKLFLWMEAERLESYPEAFSKLEYGRVYTKKTLATDAIGLIAAETGKFVRGDFLSNLYGLEVATDDKILIRGINALRQVSAGQYSPSLQAIEIGQAYAQKDKSAWLHGLAKLVSYYEIRTRLLLYLLGKAGGKLFFPGGDFFGSRSSHAVLSGVGSDIPLFADNSKQFNQLLQEYRWIALGSWWENEIKTHNMQLDHDFRFEGLRESNPPTNWLNTRLKNSLFLMKYLGILKNQAGGWEVDPVQATTIFGEDIAQDFVEVEFDRSPLQHLQEWQANLKDELGFVIVSELVQRWKEYKSISMNEAEIEFDNWMRQQIYHGSIRILETHAGQPRLGRGLNGVETARKIRFEIMEA